MNIQIHGKRDGPPYCCSFWFLANVQNFVTFPHAHIMKTYNKKMSNKMSKKMTKKIS